MGLGESFKDFFKFGKKVEATQAPPPVITPLNPTDAMQRPIDVANQQAAATGETQPVEPVPDPKPAA